MLRLQNARTPEHIAAVAPAQCPGEQALLLMATRQRPLPQMQMAMLLEGLCRQRGRPLRSWAAPDSLRWLEAACMAVMSAQACQQRLADPLRPGHPLQSHVQGLARLGDVHTGALEADGPAGGKAWRSDQDERLRGLNLEFGVSNRQGEGLCCEAVESILPRAACPPHNSAVNGRRYDCGNS
jgi:hypothetical protein